MTSTLDKPSKILLLSLTCFNGTGGVQKTCRTLCFTLMSICRLLPKSNFEMHVLYDKPINQNYLPKNQFKAYNGNKLNFLFTNIIKGCQQDYVILSHVNLLPIAWCISLLSKRTKIFLLAHGTEIWRELSPWKKRLMKSNVSIWAVSQFTKDTIINTHNFCPSKVQVINNCLDPFFKLPTAFYKPDPLLERHNISPDQPVILTVCRLNRDEHKKGYETVLKLIPRLLRQFPTIRYLMAGQIELSERHRLERLIRKLRISQNVSILGFIPDSELIDYYLLSDLFVLPSKKEGFGLVFIEAAACGCKIISGNIDGSNDAILNGQLGKGVNPNNEFEIEVAIIESLKMDRCAVFSKKIQALCLEHFSQSSYQQKIKASLYDK